ncbi:MAG: hypothetical protein WC549_00240 [Actinomycetota bacterium]
MKQNITADDLNRLSEKGRERLRKWWKPIGNEYIYSPTYKIGSPNIQGWAVHQMFDSWAKDWNKMKKEFEWVKLSLPLLSIGQLMELLDDFSPYDYSYKYWSAWLGENKPCKSYPICDLLWKKVKEELEK